MPLPHFYLLIYLHQLLHINNIPRLFLYVPIIYTKRFIRLVKYLWVCVDENKTNKQQQIPSFSLFWLQSSFVTSFVMVYNIIDIKNPSILFHCSFYFLLTVQPMVDFRLYHLNSYIILSQVRYLIQSKQRLL